MIFMQRPLLYVCKHIVLPTSSAQLTSKSKDLLKTQWCIITFRTLHICPLLCNDAKQKSSLRTLYHKNIGLLDLHKRSEAEVFVKNLRKQERKSLLFELQKYHLDNGNQNEADETLVTKQQLKTLFMFNMTPFIGFGLLDNAIMILAGDYIDHHIGLALGISTMAAAALGNLVSDLCGIGLAGYVEVLCSRLGLPVPDLSPEQMDLSSSRVYSHLGKAVGITIGCIIGMFPLLFLNKSHDKTDK